MPGAAAFSCSAPALPSNTTCAGSKRICRRPGVAIRALRTELLGLAIAGPQVARVALAADRRRRFERGASVPVVSRDGRRACCRRTSAASRSPASWATRSGCPRIASSRSTTRSSPPVPISDCVHFGARALNSLRLEKSFGNWAREYRPIYTPAEAGLDRFVDVAKPEFIGRDCGAARPRASARAPARHVRRRCDRGGRDRRRAGVARRRSRRLDHLGRLRPLRRQVDRAGLRSCRPSRPRARASRSRSSASVGRRRSRRSRCTTRRASACGVHDGARCRCGSCWGSPDSRRWRYTSRCCERGFSATISGCCMRSTPVTVPVEPRAASDRCSSPAWGRPAINIDRWRWRRTP